MSSHYLCKTAFYAELGTQQFCRGNVTMFSGHKVVFNCHFTIFVVATPSRHWGLTIFRLFSGPWLVPEAVLHCRVVAKLKNCCVPSSGFMQLLKHIKRSKIDINLSFLTSWIKSHLSSFVFITKPNPYRSFHSQM